MPRAETVVQKPKMNWNTQKPGAWEKYKVESKKVAEKIETDRN